MRLFEKTVGLIALFLICLNFSCSEEADIGCTEKPYLEVTLSQNELPIDGGSLSLKLVNPDLAVDVLIINSRKDAYYQGDGVFHSENSDTYVAHKTECETKFIYQSKKDETEIINVSIDKGNIELNFPPNNTGENRRFLLVGICAHEGMFNVEIPQNVTSTDNK